MGRGIGMRAVAGGNDVEVVDRNPEDAQALAAELGGGATAVEPDGPIGGDVVVLALYYASIAEAVDQYRERLSGKVVVDISVPLDWDTMDGFVVPADSSAGEEVQKLLPDGTPVVKAFCTTFARTLRTRREERRPARRPDGGRRRGRQGDRSRRSSRAAACGRSISARFVAPGSSRMRPFCTWPRRSRSAQGSTRR